MIMNILLHTVMPQMMWALVDTVQSAGEEEDDDLFHNLSAYAPLRYWSQYGQDRQLISQFFPTDAARQRRGVFVELGAFDGVEHSNTLAFERILGWTGVLIEPMDGAFERLRRNRPNCSCVHACVARIAGEYEFVESGATSQFVPHRVDAASSNGTRRCRTLPDILDEYFGGPGHIDYLSLDVEGNEIDILQSLDLRRHTIDVISVEATNLLGLGRSERLANHLLNRGFQFADRVGMDEIYVFRRGYQPDPTCMLPTAVLFESSLRSWSNFRAILRDFAEGLPAHHDLPEDSLEHLRLTPSDHPDLFLFWNRKDASATAEQCPVGMLTMGLAMALSNNHRSYRGFDRAALATELAKQEVFHPPSMLQDVIRWYYSHQAEAISSSERSGVAYHVRYVLGRPWHEVSFVAALESGWPLFGLLDFAGRFISSGGAGSLHDFINGPAGEMKVPWQVPMSPCTLDVRDNGEEVVFSMGDHVKTRLHLGPRASKADLALNSDVCGLLGVATARFHGAREFLRRRREVFKDRYIPLENWTAACFSGGLLGPYGRERCSALPPELCSALGDGGEVVPRRCLRLHPSPGQWLQVRQRLGIAGSTAARLVEQGEQLVREFVQRHGLFAAVWASASAPLVARGGAIGGPFATLQALQSDIEW